MMCIPVFAVVRHYGVDMIDLSNEVVDARGLDRIISRT